MRKVMFMNGRNVEHNGEEYEVKKGTWSENGTTYKTEFKSSEFKVVIRYLELKYDHIEFEEEISENESKYLYFGFDGLKEKVDKHFSMNRNSHLTLSNHELEVVLYNMTKFHYSHIEAHFHFSPFLGLTMFGDYESLTVSSRGHCFAKPTLMGDNKIKIVQSSFSYSGKAQISLGHNSRSLWLQITKNNRKTTQLNFVPNTKFNVKMREEA